MSVKTARRHARKRARQKAAAHHQASQPVAAAIEHAPLSADERPLLPDETGDPDGPWTPQFPDGAPPRVEPLDLDTRYEIIAGVRVGLTWAEAGLRMQVDRDALAAHLQADPALRNELRAAEIELKVHFLEILYHGKGSENIRAAKWFLKCRYPAEYDPQIVSSYIRAELKAELKAQEAAERAALKEGRMTEKRQRRLAQFARREAREILRRFRKAAAAGDEEAAAWLAKHEHKSPEALIEQYRACDHLPAAVPCPPDDRPRDPSSARPADNAPAPQASPSPDAAPVPAAGPAGEPVPAGEPAEPSPTASSRPRAGSSAVAAG